MLSCPWTLRCPCPCPCPCSGGGAPALDGLVIPVGGLSDDGPELCGVPSPTKPFMASELTKLENIPQPEESDDEVEGMLSTFVALADTSPPPLCPPLRRSENSDNEFKNALLTAGLDEGAGDEAMPGFCPLGGAPLLGGFESGRYQYIQHKTLIL